MGLGGLPNRIPPNDHSGTDTRGKGQMATIPSPLVPLPRWPRTPTAIPFPLRNVQGKKAEEIGQIMASEGREGKGKMIKSAKKWGEGGGGRGGARPLLWALYGPFKKDHLSFKFQVLSFLLLLLDQRPQNGGHSQSLDGQVTGAIFSRQRRESGRNPQKADRMEDKGSKAGEGGRRKGGRGRGKIIFKRKGNGGDGEGSE